MAVAQPYRVRVWVSRGEWPPRPNRTHPQAETKTDFQSVMAYFFQELTDQTGCFTRLFDARQMARATDDMK